MRACVCVCEREREREREREMDRGKLSILEDRPSPVTHAQGLRDIPQRWGAVVWPRHSVRLLQEAVASDGKD